MQNWKMHNTTVVRDSFSVASTAVHWIIFFVIIKRCVTNSCLGLVSTQTQSYKNIHKHNVQKESITVVQMRVWKHHCMK